MSVALALAASALAAQAGPAAVVARAGIGTDADVLVARYLPDFKSANAGTVTIRQLLRHQSGLPNPDDTAADPEATPAYYTAAYKGSRDPLTGYCAGQGKGFSHDLLPAAACP
ncbi:hypothetical protein COC42_08860 [Sphingomonas spermidinifaciens]|uniref:Beta-lactamase-related domain-containing protein n=1 Tax=Sphingomonas spermidinifaciens TaxID=1141889 RepID=A0A2A4B9M7_9SPHN|nr:serine hydrolase [Sphingomonas spermidinifaciens]PCD04366.1 hypothetical protein COC42_08860 [Sphingomonas spermidinifaciens]